MAVEVVYLPTSAPATATPVRMPRPVQTTASGKVWAWPGDWVVYDECGVSVWTGDEFRDHFEEVVPDVH